MKPLRVTVIVLATTAVVALAVLGGYAVQAAGGGRLWSVESSGSASRPSEVGPSGAGGSPAPASPSPSASPSTPAARPAFVLRPGDTGEQVRALQHRLFQLAWLPELTTGTYDRATRAAVAGFQGRRGLEQTGLVDRRTWRRLVAMTDQPTHDQLFNVLHPGPVLVGTGASGDGVRDVQARLKQIAWLFGDISGSYDAATVEAVRGFQAKREIPVTGEVDRRTMDRLVAMTTTPTYEELHNLAPDPGALDARCRTGRVMCIDKSTSTLRWVVDGKVQLTLDARFGSTLNDTPTREGLFHVYLMDDDHVSRLYGSSMPYSMFFSGGQAVHYSSDFAAVGYAGASHGCVNIRDYDGIQWLFSQVRVGDAVVVYWS